jgi:signal transduction histidine kinase
MLLVLTQLVAGHGLAGSARGMMAGCAHSRTHPTPRLSSVEEPAMEAGLGDAIALTHGEVIKNSVSLRRKSRRRCARSGRSVQLQQVILNLIINAIEAISGLGERPRELLIGTAKAKSDSVIVAVQDSNPGLAPATLDRILDAFYTTKPGGPGIGRSICLPSLKRMGGRLWATTIVPQGAIFNFTLPAHQIVHRDLVLAPSGR